MNVHENARLTPRGREILISRLERGEHALDVATAMGVSASTVYKWWRRHRMFAKDELSQLRMADGQPRFDLFPDDVLVSLGLDSTIRHDHLDQGWECP